MRTLNAQIVKETLAELGINASAYTFGDRGKTLLLVNRMSERKTVNLTIGMGESESAVIARIGAACGAAVPEFLST